MHFDTHAHLDQTDFDADRAGDDRAGPAAGVETIVAIGVTANSSAAVCGWPENTRASMRRSAFIRTIVPKLRLRIGIASSHLLRSLVLWRSAKPVWTNIATTHRSNCKRNISTGICGLSQERDLPFIVHTRESQAEVLEDARDARKRGPLRGIMHSFTGDAAAAAECVALGMHISFAGMVTFKKSDDLRAVAAGVPANRILVETDSPYLSPHPLRGKRNEPANVALTAACLAAVRGASVEEFAAQTAANARRLFRLG